MTSRTWLLSVWLMGTACGAETGAQGGDSAAGDGGAGGAAPEPCGATALGSTDPRFAELTSEIEAWQAAEGISGVAWACGKPAHPRSWACWGRARPAPALR